MSSHSAPSFRNTAPRTPGRSAPPPENSLISQIKQKMPIDEEVGRYVQLRDAPGGELKGKCCFHEDNNPSLYVNTSAGTYCCHGCGATGNVVTFITAMEGGDYETTKMELAERLGLLKPREKSSPERLLQSSAQRYQGALSSARNASAYLAQRGISDESIKKFGIGFCWGNEFANATPSMVADAIKAGLYSERSGRSYLGGRVTVPIRNHKGEVVAFGGRALDRQREADIGAQTREPPPKYLNTRETDYFVKSELLFGLHESRPGIVKAGYAVVVEGYFDVITLNQHGAENAVGLMGANASPKAFERLWKHTREVVFCLDGDAAGEQGVMQSIFAAAASMKDGQVIKVATLPDGMDPDEYIVKHGHEGWNEFITKSTPLSEHLASKAVGRFDIGTIEGRAAFLAHQKDVADMFETAPMVKQGIIEHSEGIIHAQVVKQCLAGLRQGARPQDVTDDAIRSIIASLERAMSIKPGAPRAEAEMVHDHADVSSPSTPARPAQQPAAAAPSPAAAPAPQVRPGAPEAPRQGPRRLTLGKGSSAAVQTNAPKQRAHEPRKLTRLLAASDSDGDDDFAPPAPMEDEMSQDQDQDQDRPTVQAAGMARKRFGR